MAENMTTSIFLIGNEFQCAPPRFSLAEKRKRRADETREMKKSLKGIFMSELKLRPPEEHHTGMRGLLSGFKCARVALRVHEVCLSM